MGLFPPTCCEAEVSKLAGGVILSDVLALFAHVLPPVPIQLSMSKRGKGENSLEVNISIFVAGFHLECFHPYHPWTVGEEIAKSSLFCHCDTINESQNKDSCCKGLKI